MRAGGHANAVRPDHIVGRQSSEELPSSAESHHALRLLCVGAVQGLCACWCGLMWEGLKLWDLALESSGERQNPPVEQPARQGQTQGENPAPEDERHLDGCQEVRLQESLVLTPSSR